VISDSFNRVLGKIRSLENRIGEVAHGGRVQREQKAPREKKAAFNQVLDKEKGKVVNLIQRGKGRPFSDIVESASRRYNVPPNLIRAVIEAESGNNVYAKSPKGAMGLMQLMPQTARALRVRNVYDPADNVDGGTRYLRQLLDRFGNDWGKALAAYNAGPTRVQKENGIPDISETQNYVKRVLRFYQQHNGLKG